jgi:predicted dinucleotide-binding enzyme
VTDGRAVEDLVVGVLGGTGPQGRGLAVRLAAVGQQILLGSRDAERAAEVAAEVAARTSTSPAPPTW